MRAASAALPQVNRACDTSLYTMQCAVEVNPQVGEKLLGPASHAMQLRQPCTQALNTVAMHTIASCLRSLALIYILATLHTGFKSLLMQTASL